MSNLYLIKNRAFRTALFILLVAMAGVTNAQTQGALNGAFRVSQYAIVNFSQGNLQYKASSNTWQFAANQYDYIGNSNGNISQTYSGWIDLFGWGTSGYDHGAVCYQPWSTSQTDSDYYAYGQYDWGLSNQTGQADWGYNAISNGGNQQNSGWRTLTLSEWEYVFNTRSTPSGIRYAMANVNNVNGVILLPDDWNADYYTLNSTNTTDAGFSGNTISSTQWNTLEQHGAVFLPAAGYRSGTSVNNVGFYGFYWSSSGHASGAFYVRFGDSYLNPNCGYNHCRYLGMSVRLVRSPQNCSVIQASPNPSSGGSVIGGGAYFNGSTCTLTALTAIGSVFTCWTKDGVEISTNATYSFTVTEDAEYVANFIVVNGSFNNSFTNSNYYLPSYSYYNYSLTQQIYTPDEIGPARTISSFRFFNAAGVTKTRRYVFYLKPTQKSVFANSADWETVTEADQVFSGIVTMTSGTWTVINLDTPFVYDGTSNLVLVADDNTGSWTQPNNMSCFVSFAAGNQAIYTYSDNTNYNPSNPAVYTGTLLQVKNCDVFCNPNLNHTVSIFSNPTTGGSTSGGGMYQYGSACVVRAIPNSGYGFGNWTRNGEPVSGEPWYAFSVFANCQMTANFYSTNAITFADANVKALCVAHWDTNGDGEISYAEAASVTSFGTVFQNNTSITSFAELQYFTGLIGGIGSGAFSGCVNLTTVTLPGSLHAVGTDAFMNCTALNTVRYTGTVAQWCSIHFANEYSNPLGYANLFYVNNALVRNLVIPNTVTSIGDFAFYNYQSLLSLTLPDAATNIGSYAFYNCGGITGNLTLPNTLTTIGANAFYNCTGFTGNLVLPGNLINIGTHAFYNCTGFTGNLVLPSNLINIDTHAFYNCTGFTGNLMLPNSLTNLGSFAFYHCSGFTGGLTIPESLSMINECVFSDCYGFTGDLLLPNSVGTIQNNAFYNCDGFTSLVIPNSMTSIGSYAFYDSDGLTSVTIGTSVSQIGNRAFESCNNLSEVNFNPTGCNSGYLFQYCNNLHTLSFGENVLTLANDAFTYCTNLQTINSLAVKPPVISNDVFPSSIYGIPLYVPCEALSAYQADPIWGNFTNYQSSAYMLTAVPEDAAQGYVSIEKYGDCDDPVSIVKADPKLHYGFSCWLKDGVSVSNDRIYTFNLEENTHLVAHFESDENITNHWVPNIDPYEDYMPVMAVVQIDGVEQISTTLELGAFCGEECRGSALAIYVAPVDRYIYQLSVYGDNGDDITFRLFDHTTQTELDLTPEAGITYTVNGSYGTGNNPYPINFVSMVAVYALVSPADAGTVTGAGNYVPGSDATLTAIANEGYVFNSWKTGGNTVSTEVSYTFTVTQAVTLTACFDRLQTTALNNGWNWFSIFIEQSGSNGLEQLENSLGANGELIKSRTGQMVENLGGSYWWGGLNALDNSQMYMVKTNAACEVSLQGAKADTWQHSITLSPGWNWIGYVPDTEMPLNTALASFTPNDGDILKSRTVFTTYYANWGWYGNLTTLTPGQGYRYQSTGNGSQSFTYPAPSKGGLSISDNAVPCHFTVRGDDQPYNMNVMATVLLDSEELSGDRYELAAFVGSVCRGTSRLMYVEPLNRYVAFLTVLGEDEVPLSFRLYDSETGLCYESDETVGFEADAVLGRLDGLMPIHFNGNATVGNTLSLYPNPASQGSTLCVDGLDERPVTVEVVNLLGVRVGSLTVTGQTGQFDCDLTPGAYTVRFVRNQEVLKIEKLIVK